MTQVMYRVGVLSSRLFKTVKKHQKRLFYLLGLDYRQTNILSGKRRLKQVTLCPGLLYRQPIKEGQPEISTPKTLNGSG